MLQNIHIEERIQSYMDGLCNEAERIEIAENIKSIPAWRDTYTSLHEIHILLQQDIEPMEPSMRFSKNVMDEIAGLKIARPIQQFINPWIFRITAGILGVFLLAIVGYAFSLTDFSSGISDSNLPIPSIQMPTVNWTSYLGQGTTMMLFMICTILGLYLADKLLSKKLGKQL
jgi:hypothetical protein